MSLKCLPKPTGKLCVWPSRVKASTNANQLSCIIAILPEDAVSFPTLVFVDPGIMVLFCTMVMLDAQMISSSKRAKLGMQP